MARTTVTNPDGTISIVDNGTIVWTTTPDRLREHNMRERALLAVDDLTDDLAGWDALTTAQRFNVMRRMLRMTLLLARLTLARLETETV